MATVIFEEQVEVPLGIETLGDFRRWSQSEDFPEQGRIDYIAGHIEVDMSPEEFFAHGTPKVRIIAALSDIVEDEDLGHLVTDSTRISSPEADLSAEPDLVFISHESLQEGRVRLVPKASGEAGRFVEVEGGPDLIVEIVSDSSEKKDRQRLPQAYFAAGVREFWLIDARGEELHFQIHHRGGAGFEPAAADDEGRQQSVVFGRPFGLTRDRHRLGHWVYELASE